MDVRVGLWRKLSMKNCCFWTVVLEKTLESPLDCKEIQPVHPKGDQAGCSLKDRCWSWHSNTLAASRVELTHWKRPWCRERLKAWGEGDDRGWDGWMASPTRWTWVWVNSGSWWWTGRPGALQFMGSQSRTRLSDWTELNWAENRKLYKYQLTIECINSLACDYKGKSPHWKHTEATCGNIYETHKWKNQG